MTSTELRKALAIILGSAAVLIGYVALTVPVFAMTGPTVLTIALVAATWFVWPRQKQQAASKNQPTA
jgi:hypothetical protein